MAFFPRHVPAALTETILFIVVAAGLFIGTLLHGNFQPADRFFIKNFGRSSVYLDQALSAREITMITRNTAQSYYLYRDQAMGFEYDLANAFAEYIGVRLTVEVVDDWQGMLSRLKETPAGFIAAGMMLPASRINSAAFSSGYLPSRQLIIVHRENRKIRSPKDLAGQSVHVRKGSIYEESLEALKAGGIDVEIVPWEDIPTEELIRRVAEKTIGITIADSTVAILNRRYYPQIVLGEPVSDEAYRRWAVEPEAEGLLLRINQFFKTIHANGRFAEIYDRYYADVDDFDFVDLRAYHRRLKSHLPKFKPVIQKAADAYGFDWRLIAAQIYQESHFNPRAMSHAGAFGLMQLTKTTAASLNVKDLFDPEENIQAGVRHLKYLYDYFHEAESMDRMSLALAAYNIGQGHLFDARKLAAEQQLDPNKWSSVSETLPLLRYPKYYRRSIYGYCRGTEPVEYVKQTMIYFDILKYRDMMWYPGYQALDGGKG
jgi:membrane-bound lytic murein transglycosylase F